MPLFRLAARIWFLAYPDWFLIVQQKKKNTWNLICKNHLEAWACKVNPVNTTVSQAGRSGRSQADFSVSNPEWWKCWDLLCSYWHPFYPRNPCEWSVMTVRRNSIWIATHVTPETHANGQWWRDVEIQFGLLANNSVGSDAKRSDLRNKSNCSLSIA